MKIRQAGNFPKGYFYTYLLDQVERNTDIKVVPNSVFYTAHGVTGQFVFGLDKENDRITIEPVRD